jgi:hypothetical protein
MVVKTISEMPLTVYPDGIAPRGGKFVVIPAAASALPGDV